MTANANAANEMPIGLVTVGKTTYEVYRYAVSELAAKNGVRHRLGLIGPRGSTFYVEDNGPKFKLIAFAFGPRIAPRDMKGITRAHLAAFGVES